MTAAQELLDPLPQMGRWSSPIARASSYGLDRNQSLASW